MVGWTMVEQCAGRGIQSGLTLYSTKILYTDLTVITLITEYQLQELYLKECQTALHYLVCWIWCPANVPYKVLYSGKFWRVKTFVNFKLFAKVFSQNLGVWHPLAVQASNPWKFSLQKLYFFNNSLKISPLKVFRYTVAVCSHLLCCQEASLWLLLAGMLLRIHSSHSTVDFNSLRT